MFGALTYKRPINLVIIANIAAYAVLALYKQPFDRNVPIACFLVTGLILTTYCIITWLKMGDEYIFLIVSMLLSIGLIMIYRLDPKTGLKQLAWFVAGIMLFLVTYVLFSKIRLWNRLGFIYAAASIALNIATLVLGRRINGAKSWIIIAGHSFQLSEIVKIIFILFLACYFDRQKEGMVHVRALKFLSKDAQNRIFLAGVTFMNIILMIFQREWGTVALFFLLYIILLYVFGNDRKFLIANMVTAIPIALFAYFFIYHIRVRFDMWLDPWSDASGKGYQILQSLFAIGTGSFLGTGIGKGQPNLIPAVNTDFIFSAICEEMGVLIGIAIILLYFILCYRGIKIVLGIKSGFYKVLSLGVSVMFGIQTFIIIGGVIKLIPLTGITLPFVSYGGSSLISSFILLGILQAVSKLQQKNVIGEESIEEDLEQGK